MSRIYDILAPVLGVSTALALLCVLILLILGRFRAYFTLALYVAWELLATIGFTIADVVYHGSAPTSPGGRTVAQLWYARLYWANDVLVDLFRFVLVIVLIYLASDGRRQVAKRGLAALVLLAVALPFILFDIHLGMARIDPLHLKFPDGSWFNSTSELLNFGAAIMNLLLWTTLLSSKRRDPYILGVSLGLGLVVTGTAFSYGLHYLLDQKQYAAAGSLIMNLTQLVGWLIWCRTFWPKSKHGKAAIPSPPGDRISV